MGVSHREPIKFANLTFKTGLNITIRPGDMWYGSTGLYTALGPKGTEAKIRIVETYKGVYKELLNNQMIIELFHDPELRQYYNLFKFLQRQYPGRPDFADEPMFAQDAEITLVYFVITTWGDAEKQGMDEEEE